MGDKGLSILLQFALGRFSALTDKFLLVFSLRASTNIDVPKLID